VAATTRARKRPRPRPPHRRSASPAPTDGTNIKGNVVTLAVESPGIEIKKADGDTSGRTGHYHVFIDGDPVAPGEVIAKGPGIVHSADNPIVIYGLTAGSHKLTVVLGNGAHARIGSSKSTVTVVVAGPSLDATALATVAANQPFDVEAVVTGVNLVKADGDTSGRTGHLHVFVDQLPTAAGPPGIIHSATSPVHIPGLTAGEHTLWVVLGDGTHRPFDPPVMDKLTLTVT
jgi:hypothetical protein